MRERERVDEMRRNEIDQGKIERLERREEGREEGELNGLF
jgi:hypothetical protein